MNLNLRYLIILPIILFLGALLIIAPFAIRVAMSHLNQRSYQPPDIELVERAATPVPTPTAMPVSQAVIMPQDELVRGPVWVDLAHLSWLDPGQFESLADALAARGIGLRFWVSSVDLVELESPADFPDQSEELSLLLHDASGLVAISPFYLWTPAEITLVEEFVADGGRLLLISDPDVPGDVPWNINSLGEPFGVVFNDDYLYDLSRNDGNYTHIFQGAFLDQAAPLNGKIVAFYGARSINGPVISQARSADTTLSSLRSGFTHFATVAIGGRETSGTAGNVLAMGDFDVLTEPYVARHDNRVVLEFVADFLANAQREQTLPDFPGYLGRQVVLAFGGGVSVDAKLLQRSGGLQQRLEETGRVLTLSNSTGLTPTTHLTETLVITETITTTATPSAPESGGAEPRDLIYLGTYQSANEETILLATAGIHLVEESETPEGTETYQALTDEPKEEGGIEQAAPATVPIPKLEGTPVPEPESTLLLETDSGLRFLAAEIVLILQQEQDDDSRVIAVLGSDSQAIGDGLNRLLYHFFDDCVNHVDVSICPFFREEGPVNGPTDVTVDDSPTRPEETPAPAPADRGIAILVIDDNDQATLDEPSEAAIYLQTLSEMGYAPVSWYTADLGGPSEADLVGYDWVIWSGGLYQASGPDIDEQEMLWAFVSEAGKKLTISGRNHPLAGESPREASIILDVVKTDEVPTLVMGFPDEPIDLLASLPPVVPISVQADDYGPDVTMSVALRRGPNSADADAPLVVAFTATIEPDLAEVRVLVLGLALNWLPDDYAPQLVQNMAAWMLGELQ